MPCAINIRRTRSRVCARSCGCWSSSRSSRPSGRCSIRKHRPGCCRPDAMAKPSWFQPSQMQALNPALVMLLIPFNNLVLYPALRAFRIRTDGVTTNDCRHRLCRSLLDRGRRDATGARPRQRFHDHLAGAALSSCSRLAKCCVATTGLEFAYSQAPPSMKGAIMAFWNLVGNHRQPLGAGGECRMCKTLRSRRSSPRPALA